MSLRPLWFVVAIALTAPACDSESDSPTGSGGGGAGGSGGVGGVINPDSGHFARAVVCHKRCEAKATACAKSTNSCSSFCTKDTQEIVLRCWEQLDCALLTDGQGQAAAMEKCVVEATDACYPIPLADETYCGESRGLPPSYWFCPIDQTSLPSTECVSLSDIGNCCPAS